MGITKYVCDDPERQPRRPKRVDESKCRSESLSLLTQVMKNPANLLVKTPFLNLPLNLSWPRRCGYDTMKILCEVLPPFDEKEGKLNFIQLCARSLDRSLGCLQSG
jgi:hypothetical protein